MKNIAQETLANIALSNHAVIQVFEKHGLDFCCGGKKTLADACSEKNLAVTSIVSELGEISGNRRSVLPFTEMTAAELIFYITIHHHFYVKNNVGTILSHIERVVIKHGEKYPHMNEVYRLFQALIDELLPHMEKEEQMLFPAIKRLAESIKNGDYGNNADSLLTIPIQVLEAEHDHAGQLLFKIREITNDYTHPENACTTHKVCLDELSYFEKDLHQHVHLENNLLFPMAIKLSEEVAPKSCSL